MKALLREILTGVGAGIQRDAGHAARPSAPAQHRHRVEACLRVARRADGKVRPDDTASRIRMRTNEALQVVARIEYVLERRVVLRSRKSGK